MPLHSIPSKPAFSFQGLSVLELGCGAGLPSLLCLSRGASPVHLQDYNPDVVDRLAVPNALNNAPSSAELKFYSGDWGSLNDHLSTQYDLILTSETIYNVSNQKKLLAVFEKCLKSDGRVLLAAKTCYFGVGGGLRQFEKVLEESGKWEYKTVRKIDQGVKREILELTRKQ